MTADRDLAEAGSRHAEPTVSFWLRLCGNALMDMEWDDVGRLSGQDLISAGGTRARLGPSELQVTEGQRPFQARIAASNGPTPRILMVRFRL